MQPRHTPALKDVLLWSVFLSSLATTVALQQQPYYTARPDVDRLYVYQWVQFLEGPGGQYGGTWDSFWDGDGARPAILARSKIFQHSLARSASEAPSPSDAAASSQDRWRAAAADSLNTPASNHRGFRDTDNQEPYRSSSRSQPRSSLNERALATFAPAEAHPAVRAPPASRSSATAGLTTRQPARSLQDWRVEDIILLATVDGKIYARDRVTGLPKWELEVDKPMVETINHRHNKSTESSALEEDTLWIVEPSQDGDIFVLAPHSGMGVQRLGLTVKALADLSPYRSDEPSVVYTAEKKVTLYTIDAATGHIMKVFSSAGASQNAERSCRRVNPLEAMDEEECEPIGTITLGRTEYTVAIQDHDSGEPISTIKYYEWGPNNRDQDLRSKYASTMDRRYVYSMHNGDVVGYKLGEGNSYQTTSKPAYSQHFGSPVVRVYDLVRPIDDQSSDASLVVLPQPVAPSWNEFKDLEDDVPETVYVNCTKDGNWYALSDTNYPGVAEHAPVAQWYNEDHFSLPGLFWKDYRDRFAGKHMLFPQNQRPSTPLIGAPEYPGIDPPPPHAPANQRGVAIPGTARWQDQLPSVRAFLFAMLLVLGGLGGVVLQQKGALPFGRAKAPIQMPSAIDVLASREVKHDEQTPSTPMVREAEPAKEIIFPHEVNDTKSTVEQTEDLSKSDDAALEQVRSNDADEGDEDEPGKDAKPKAHKRGKRGGRKAKEKEQAQAEARAKRKGSQVPQPAEVISVAASESPQVSGPLQINSLIIHTDKVIGQGSCGTSVFEGSFEGRDVAVKRMLSQYYELASQEVSFLQQSDDHPNVVRYFCQQKDDHFLYIAVELCQASLFEVWEAEKARSEERQQQLRLLKLSIQQDTPKALQQLAAGLYHLHNLRIIHRDIKPQNILVAFPKRNQNIGPRLVISDFGLGKNLPENVSTLIDPTGNAGTSGWKAPELISQPKDSASQHSQSHSNTNGNDSTNGPNGPSGVKRAADIFSLGCLFFWVLTDGIHPYEDENGWQQLRELNIKRDNKKMGVLERWSDAYEPMQLITSMLAHQPEDRPTALQVLNHPFFWSAETRLAFLCDCSDHFEREPRGTVDEGYASDSAHLRLLERRAGEVIGIPTDFLAKLDRHFVDTLGKQRKYSGNRLLDLLRALRNKKNHYEDMPEDVKKRVGPLAGGYLRYWSVRFPRLLMACYEVIHEAGIQDGDRFRRYFVLDG